MTSAEDTWTELRYSGKQILPETDGVADELDAVSWWDVEAVRCGFDSEEVTGRGAVAVFDVRRPAALATAVAAYGGNVAHVGAVLLTSDGCPREGIVDGPIDSIVVFLGVDVTTAGADAGLPLRSADLIRQRLAGSSALIASYPRRHTEDEVAPSFLDGVPQAVRTAWAARGLTHAGRGVWTLPLVGD
ncbi:hypothetical protein ACXR2U_03220 [Jatrophihabitans sp. YIM 134969]